jgi:hypothetical protein
LLTGKGGCEYKCPVLPILQSDPIDDKFEDANCDGSDGVVEGCVYVSASTGSDDDASANGTRFKPYATIGKAIQAAAANNIPGVCVSGEIYNEQVTLVSGVSLYGGFDHLDNEFAFRRKEGITTTIRAKGTVIIAPKIDVETHVEGLTIIADKNSETPGESTYGIRLLGGAGRLWVRWNDITVGDGNDGIDGESPAQAPKASDGVTGQEGCDACSGNGTGAPPPVCEIPGGKGGDGGYKEASGTKGGDGSSGAVGGGGGKAVSCISSGDGGKTGGNATTPGENGGPGGPGANLGTLSEQFYTPASGKDGVKGGNGASGGGGGGGGGSEKFLGLFCNPDKGGGGGSGGCGGLGGLPGKGGMGGGGSFGIFVVGGQVDVDKNQITVGKGGKGGKGGNGATGQQGGNGGSGGPGKDNSGAGGPGGSGSPGGSGGPGGGGGGGPSACVAHAAGVNITGKGFCTSGTPGFGGPGGTNSAGLKGADGEVGLSSPVLVFN